MISCAESPSRRNAGSPSTKGWFDAGLDLTGWRLDYAEGISADGRAIAGYGFDPDGHREAWLVRFSLPAHAAPFSSLSRGILSALAGLLLIPNAWATTRRRRDAMG